MDIKTLYDNWSETGSNFKKMKKLFKDFDDSIGMQLCNSQNIEVMSYSSEYTDDSNMAFFILRDDYLEEIKTFFQAKVGRIKKSDYDTGLLKEVEDKHNCMFVLYNKSGVSKTRYFIGESAIKSLSQVLHCQCDAISGRRDLFSDLFLVNAMKKPGENKTYNVNFIYRECQNARKILYSVSSRNTIIPYSDVTELISRLNLEKKQIQYKITNGLAEVVVRLTEDDVAPCLIIKNSYTGVSSFAVYYGIADKAGNYLVGGARYYPHDRTYDFTRVLQDTKAISERFISRAKKAISTYNSSKEDVDVQIELTEILCQLRHEKKRVEFMEKYKLNDLIMKPDAFLRLLVSIPSLYAGYALKNNVIEVNKLRRVAWPLAFDV